MQELLIATDLYLSLKEDLKAGIEALSYYGALLWVSQEVTKKQIVNPAPIKNAIARRSQTFNNDYQQVLSSRYFQDILRFLYT